MSKCDKSQEEVYFCANCHQPVNLQASGHYDSKTNAWLCKRWEPDKDAQLVLWFQQLFASRTPPRAINDAHPDYRVTWHETNAKMRELGYGDSNLNNRIAFAKLFVEKKLRGWCNRLIRASGGSLLMSEESEAAKESRESY